MRFVNRIYLFRSADKSFFSANMRRKFFRVTLIMERLKMQENLISLHSWTPNTRYSLNSTGFLNMEPFDQLSWTSRPQEPTFQNSTASPHTTPSFAATVGCLVSEMLPYSGSSRKD